MYVFSQLCNFHFMKHAKKIKSLTLNFTLCTSTTIMLLVDGAWNNYYDGASDLVLYPWIKCHLFLHQLCYFCKPQISPCKRTWKKKWVEKHGSLSYHMASLCLFWLEKFTPYHEICILGKDGNNRDMNTEKKKRRKKKERKKNISSG